MYTTAERQHAAWIGGSILSICGSFQQNWISNLEYAEYGSNILLDKLQNISIGNILMLFEILNTYCVIYFVSKSNS